MLRAPLSSSFWALARCALLAAAAPWCVTLACSDDSGSGDGGSSGIGGTSTAGSGGSAANTAGSAGFSGTSGAGSGGTNASDAGPEPDGADASSPPFALTSPAIEDIAGCGPDEGDRELCDLFPEENTGLDGADNVSPQLDWTGAPPGTQSFAIALHDLSNLNGPGDPFTHWVMWNIPGSATGLPAELPEGFEPGVPADDTRQVSYLESKNNGFAGSGAAGNVYEFVLFALDVPSFEPMSSDPDEVEAAIAESSDVLGTATLRARSSPP